MDSQDAVMSDEQLEALLDRTLTSQEKKSKKEPSSTKSKQPSAPGDQSLFRVIEERDAEGNITREGDDSAPTTDTWHIVGENDGDLNTEGEKREDSTMAVTSNGSMMDNNLSDQAAGKETVAGEESNQGMSSTDGRDQNGVRGDHKESSVEDYSGQGESSAHTIESSNLQKDSNYSQPSALTLHGAEQAETIIIDTKLGETVKTDKTLPTTVDDICCNVEPLPNSSKLETANKDLVKTDVEVCGSTETPVIESNCINGVGGLDTQPDTAYSPESNVTTAKATVCMGGQLASNPETMANDCNGPVVLESNHSELSDKELEKSNATTPFALVMNEA